ncbi:MAG TPA: outer membrane beta-barrel protein [Candidatus Angelobacter sp.]
MLARSKTTLMLVAAAPILLSLSAYGQQSPSADPEIQQLRELVLKLQSRIEQLEKNQGVTAQQPGAQASVPAQVQNTALAQSTPAPEQAKTESLLLSKEDPPVLDYFRNTTVNGGVDGYYGYNFNQPIGRVNLLRAYDVSSNSFSLNQANFILEHPPDPDAGRRWGARLDFQYGQATETLQGSAANELRPQTYRPVLQAIGSYVFPAGTGLTVDFGKWVSALGVEGNYTKDQINYSRAYWFDFLPFYHMGFKAGYNVTPKINVAYWLVNGAQQTEDFNGFKSQALILTLKPLSTLTWNVNYYTGQEQLDVVPVFNPTVPARPTQPGLPVTNTSPAPKGREHIIDTYATWNATPKLTLVGEGDYVINRVFPTSAPTHVDGGAAYIKYQLTRRVYLAARGEYMSDHGGQFSGVTQALKEITATSQYKFAEGFISWLEWRRDFSNQPFFLTDVPGVLSKQQNTLTLGMTWWFGLKKGAW